jgi:type I restriction enzyme S subunit
MKQGWEIKKLGEIIVENKKSTLKSKGNSDGEFPFFISGKTIKTIDKSIIDGENIYLPTGGNFFIHFYCGKASYSTDTWSLRTNRSASIKYLFYYLLLNEKLIGEKYFKGATIKHLQKKDFKDIEIPIPPFTEQQRIVSFLDECFAAIDKAKANAEQNLKNAKKLFESYLQGVFNSGNWKMVEFGEVITLLTDYHANGSYQILKNNVELKEREDFAWMVRSTDFENNFENDFRYIDEKAYNFLSKSKVIGGEIIMSKIGNAGNVYLMPSIDKPCSLAMNLFLIRLNDKKAAPEFVFQYLKSYSGEFQIKSRLQGATTKTITKDNVKNILIPLPSLKEQQTIVRQLDVLRTETQKLEAVYQKKIYDLEELKKSILQKAFAGELKTEKAVAV